MASISYYESKIRSAQEEIEICQELKTEISNLSFDTDSCVSNLSKAADAMDRGFINGGVSADNGGIDDIILKLKNNVGSVVEVNSFIDLKITDLKESISYYRNRIEQLKDEMEKNNESSENTRGIR